MTKQERATMDSAAVKKSKIMEENKKLGDKKLTAIQLIYDIHSREPKSHYDYGLVNGLAIAIGILTEQPPKYIGDSSC